MSFFNNRNSLKRDLRFLLVVFVAAACLAGPIMAKDTDIYQISTKQNAYILMDNSLSMDSAVYEAGVDYGQVFDILFEQNESGAPWDTYIYDTINWSDIFHNNHEERNKIFLWRGNVGVSIATVAGQTTAFTGDAGGYWINWSWANLVDTHTLIDANGNLSGDGSGNPQRITTDGAGQILFDGSPLPLGQDVQLHDLVTLYDGTIVDQGFGGMMQAPGYYFSGYKGVTAGSLDTAVDGDNDIYFFTTGNWVNMHQVFNLRYTTNNPDPTGAQQWDQAWRYETVTLSGTWSTLSHSARYPASGYYANNLNVNDTMQRIVHPGAVMIQVHFSAFDVQGNWNSSSFTRDYVALYDDDGTLVAQYDNDNNPTDGDGWSVVVSGDTVGLGLHTNNSVRRTGWQIDRIRVSYNATSHKMQTRMDVAKDAMLYTLDAFHGKMNWGYATFANGVGATIHAPLNPNETDDANRAAIRNHVESTEPSGGTPLGEALQDVWDEGYYQRRTSLDNLSCRKNYIISMTDGYPSADDDWNRISGITFDDWDHDGWTADPNQYSNPPENYYDDVSNWIYTHNWMATDHPTVADPANSYDNVITHHISFGARHPLLEDAAGESGGEYITAYNKSQLVAAFYSLGLQMSEAIAFTAPVVSVNAANKIQNGDDLYLGLFLPQDSTSWNGNLKKFKLGDGSAQRPNIWMIYDSANNEAINGSGAFLDNTAAFFGDDTDLNDSDNYGYQDVKEDGVGEVLTERVAADLASGDYWERPIYTSISGTLTRLHRNSISAADLNVADDHTRDEVINYVYGYTYDADASTGAPSAVRDWALGAIVHSSPVVVDYYDPSDSSVLLKRYLVVGANDGMLHVFDDSNGEEVFAFIPEGILPKLQLLPTQPFVDTVDGDIALYRTSVNVSGSMVDNHPKYLIFGLRRGGGAYWCLNVTDMNAANWQVQWSYSNPQIAQSWARPQIVSIPVSLNSITGEVGFKDVVVFAGGYDIKEDNFPEPFTDGDGNGTPFANNGNIDNSEWSQANAAQDIYNNNAYDIFNPDIDDYGRGIFVVDIDNPASATSIGSEQVLPFSVSYGATDVATGADRKMASMKYCFPATPSVIGGSFSFIHTGGGALAESRKSNVLKMVYATDIYANIYKLDYSFEIAGTSGAYTLKKSGWNVARIFSGNPGSSSASGTFGGGIDGADVGRKTFYAPAVSWGGAGSYFDAGNYGFPDVTFSGQYDIASLYFGTGDREHPTYTIIRNRIYAVYDDSSVSGERGDGSPVQVSTIPYTESNLLNLSCGELEDGTTLSASFTKQQLTTAMTDDAEYYWGLTRNLENGLGENDAKGWYIILEDQGDATECSHCTYAGAIDDSTTSSRDNHAGEKILSQVGLYAGVLYFTSYQPSIDDPCNPQGNGFVYSLDYADGSSAYNLNAGNDGADAVTDVTDRYRKVNTIYGIPSKFAIITRHGQAGAMAMMGGKIVGPRDQNDGDGDDDSGFKIKSPGLGLELYFWREGNSQE